MGRPQQKHEDITMKAFALILALSTVAGTAQAQSMIDELCGHDHINETTGLDDVTSNPDGFYVRSLQTQLSFGDPRIVRAVGGAFHVCTRSAATPDMDSAGAFNLKTLHVVKYLLVPIGDASDLPGS